MISEADLYKYTRHRWAWASIQIQSIILLRTDLLRDALDISIPRIIVWSANRSNAVNAEFIIEEKARGDPLGNLWKSLDTLPMNYRMSILDKILEIEKKTTSIKFAKSGCIYFSSHSERLQTNSPLSPQILDRFTMVPLVSNEFGVVKRLLWISIAGHVILYLLACYFPGLTNRR
jgi:hypothetical protein